MPRVLADRALDHLEDLPYFMRGVPDFQAAIHAMSREIDLFEEARATLVRNLVVQTADEHIDIYAAGLGINLDPTLSTAQKKSLVQGYYLRARGGATEYPNTENISEVALNSLIGTGWSIQEHVVGDGSTPAEGHIRFTLPDASGSPGAALKQILVRAYIPANLVIDWLFADTATFDTDTYDSDQHFA